MRVKTKGTYVRCNNCSKFVSYGEPEKEVEAECNDTEVHVVCTITLTCGECGGELSQAVLEDSQEISCDHGEGDYEFSVLDCDVEIDERYETVNKKGKAIKPRYQRKFYQAHYTVTVQCSCGEEYEVARMVEEQASAFEPI